CLGRKRPDLLVADDAGLVDQECLRHAVHAIVDADASIAIDDRVRIRIAVLREPCAAGVGFILVIQAVYGNDVGLRELPEPRMLDTARYAPRRPHVQQPYLAL